VLKGTHRVPEGRPLIVPQLWVSGPASLPVLWDIASFVLSHQGFSGQYELGESVALPFPSLVQIAGRIWSSICTFIKFNEILKFFSLTFISFISQLRH
jgi:hypothetical protein